MRTYVIEIAAAILLFFASPIFAQDLVLQKPAPALEAVTLDGKRFSSTEQIGKVVIINFWASFCDPCREEMPVLDTYYKQHKDEGLVMIGVSMDDPADIAKVKDLVKTVSFPSALATDTKAAGYGRIWRVPLTFVIDRQGRLRRDGWLGEAKLNMAALNKIVTPLLNEH